MKRQKALFTKGRFSCIIEVSENSSSEVCGVLPLIIPGECIAVLSRRVTLPGKQIQEVITMKLSLEKGFITPHPVLIIGTYGADGRPDAMNAAWGGQIGGSQISISLSNTHLTTDNIKLNREFTVAFATADQLAACDYVGLVSGAKVSDKLDRCGFTVTKSDKVNAPIIDQLPVTIECRVIELQDEFNETRVVAEIVGLKADEEVVTDGKVDISKLGLVVYDTVGKCYRAVGDVAGGAWNIGRKFD